MMAMSPVNFMPGLASAHSIVRQKSRKRQWRIHSATSKVECRHDGAGFAWKAASLAKLLGWPKRCYFTGIFRESSRNKRLGWTLTGAPDEDLGGIKTERGYRAMWISLFTVACGIAVCLSVAAVMMQPTARRTLRG
jgi:hypothetical protein